MAEARMNYRHVFHAGNFADVMKHIALVMVIAHLKAKPKPFRVIDTHAGRGIYALGAGDAARTGEAETGYLQLVRGLRKDGSGADADTAVAAYLAACEAAVTAPVARVAAAAATAMNGEPPALYPGSPLLARTLLRAGDRLHANELHPEDVGALRTLFPRDDQTVITSRDGWHVLKAALPPKERRGLILIDPPFEKTDEFAAIAAGLAEAIRRFATGTYLVWYPIKDRSAVAAFYDAAARLAVREVIAIEVDRGPAASTDPPKRAPPLAACGLVVVNPPYEFVYAYGRALRSVAGHLAVKPNQPIAVTTRTLRAERTR
ncbi:MAG: 23S rRNA (adenine(2030)-N(6))-methyltransferase RlmJ [Pseudomonadota bacterium]